MQLDHSLFKEEWQSLLLEAHSFGTNLTDLVEQYADKVSSN